MECPACREPLIVAEREGIELDVCPWCHGLWFDTGELALLAEKLGRALRMPDGMLEPAVTTEKSRACPRCDKAMQKVYLGTSPRMLPDRCVAHGLWFDKGELGALMRQLAPTPGSHPEAVVRFMGESLEPLPAAGQASATDQTGSGEVER